MQKLTEAISYLSTDAPTKCTIHPNSDPEKMMKCVEWHGKRNMQVASRPKPVVTDPMDVLIRVTSSGICGSDLHMYVHALPNMKTGDVVGHEFMGIIEDVGSEVKNFQVGDRVVTAFDIACGQCSFCKDLQLYSSCDETNPDQTMEKLYGGKTSGVFGYSHLTGGYAGGQAEYVRVPLADNNLLKVPEELSDEQVVLLSDAFCTAWHSNELGKVGEGDVVAIWGAGPIGLLAAHCAVARGAEHVFLVDCEQDRLDLAKKKIPKVKPINFNVEDPVEAMRRVVPRGPDVGIETVGVHYPKTWSQKLQMAVGLSSDPSDVINEIIKAVRKGGRISVIGVYVGFCNNFNIGAFMEKGLSMAAGQTPVQRYWHELLHKIQTRQLDPTIAITHLYPLDQADKAYQMFDSKAEGCLKVVLKPDLKQPVVYPDGLHVTAPSPAGPQ